MTLPTKKQKVSHLASPCTTEEITPADTVIFSEVKNVMDVVVKKITGIVAKIDGAKQLRGKNAKITQHNSKLMPLMQWKTVMNHN